MEHVYSEDQDDVIYQSESGSYSVVEPIFKTTNEQPKKLDPALAKALKLYAKNHQ